MDLSTLGEFKLIGFFISSGNTIFVHLVEYSDYLVFNHGFIRLLRVPCEVLVFILL